MDKDKRHANNPVTKAPGQEKRSMVEYNLSGKKESHTLVSDAIINRNPGNYAQNLSFPNDNYPQRKEQSNLGYTNKDPSYQPADQYSSGHSAFSQSQRYEHHRPGGNLCSESRYSRSDAGNPVTDTRNSLSDRRNSLSDRRNSLSDRRSSLSDTRNPLSDARNHHLDTRNPLSDTRNPLSDTRNPLSDTRNPLSDTRNPLSDTRNPLSDTRNPLSDTRNPLSDTRNPLSDTRNPYRAFSRTTESYRSPLRESRFSPRDSTQLYSSSDSKPCDQSLNPNTSRPNWQQPSYTYQTLDQSNNSSEAPWRPPANKNLQRGSSEAFEGWSSQGQTKKPRNSNKPDKIHRTTEPRNEQHFGSFQNAKDVKYLNNSSHSRYCDESSYSSDSYSANSYTSGSTNDYKHQEESDMREKPVEDFRSKRARVPSSRDQKKPLLDRPKPYPAPSENNFSNKYATKHIKEHNVSYTGQEKKSLGRGNSSAEAGEFKIDFSNYSGMKILDPSGSTAKLNLSAYYCHVCKVGNFSSEHSYVSHLDNSLHMQYLKLLLVKNQKYVELKRASSELASLHLQKQSPPRGVFTECSYCLLKVPAKSLHQHNEILHHKELQEFIRPLCCGTKFDDRRTFVNHKNSKIHLRKKFDLEMKYVKDVVIEKNRKKSDDPGSRSSSSLEKQFHPSEEYVELLDSKLKTEMFVANDKSFYCLACEVTVPSSRKSFHVYTADHYEHVFFFSQYKVINSSKL